jgi:hypothetical protein
MISRIHSRKVPRTRADRPVSVPESVGRIPRMNMWRITKNLLGWTWIILIGTLEDLWKTRKTATKN